MADNFTYNKFPDLSPKPYSAYASLAITISGSTEGYSLKDNTDLFSHLAAPYEMRIKDVTQDIEIRLTDGSNDSIHVAAQDEFETVGFIITDIFVTVSGESDASLNVITFGWR